MRHRDQRRMPLVEQLWQDLRFGARQLTRQPVFTATAVLALALGLGASAAIFGFVDAVLIRPLPYPDPAALVMATESTPQMPRANLSVDDFRDWRRLNTSFSSLDVFTQRGYILSTDGGGQPVTGVRVSDGFFRTLGVTPALGRDFRPGEDAPGADALVILGDGAWRRRFGADPGIIGRTITLNAAPYTVIGVLPADFAFAPVGASELWTALRPSSGCDTRRSCHGLTGIARLRPGVSAEAALAEMTSIAAELERQYPDSNRGQGAYVAPLQDVVAGNVRPALLLLLGGAGLLLVIACLDVASLLLVRAEHRRHELAVRRALGASRGRLVRQFAAEALLLGAVASALAAMVSGLAVSALRSLLPADVLDALPAIQTLGFNAHIAVFIVGLGLGAAVLLTLAPLVRLPASDRASLADGARGSVRSGWRRFGFQLVVVELALATVLLAGAGLLGRSLQRLLEVDLGFRPERLAVLRIAAPPARYPTPERAAALSHAILDRARQLPGVESAGLTSVLPVSFNGNTTWIRFVGRPYNGEHNETNLREITAGYFSTIGARIVRGRDFTTADTIGSAPVMIVNRALARQYFADADPIGAQIGDTALSPDSIRTIVGVVDDVREGALDEEVWPAVYYPMDQDPDTSYGLVVRTAQTPASILPLLAAEMARLDPDLGAFGGATMMDRVVRAPVARLHRSVAWLVGGFATLAILLGAVGLYGVIASSVTERTREIGVRLALGASRPQVSRMILGESARVALFGLVLGLAATMLGGRLMGRLLFATPAWEPRVLAAAAAILTTTCLLAAWFPARRAASVDPMTAMRE